MTYEEFRRLASDPSLSPYEKIGFPNSYREGKEEAIFADILRKIPNLSRENQTVVDVGPGCSGLAFMLIDHCRSLGHKLVLVDSSEMLGQLPDEPFIDKVVGRFPDECRDLIARKAGKADVVLTYSVLHYVFEEGDITLFTDALARMLAPGGQLLIGDIPNRSKRKRFFSSEAGVRYHQEFTGTDTMPDISEDPGARPSIDDGVLLALEAHCRTSGFDAYILPQSADLPMANRREDFLVTRP